MDLSTAGESDVFMNEERKSLSPFAPLISIDTHRWTIHVLLFKIQSLCLYGYFDSTFRCRADWCKSRIKSRQTNRVDSIQVKLLTSLRLIIEIRNHRRDTWKFRQPKTIYLNLYWTHKTFITFVFHFPPGIRLRLHLFARSKQPRVLQTIYSGTHTAYECVVFEIEFSFSGGWAIDIFPENLSFWLIQSMPKRLPFSYSQFIRFNRAVVLWNAITSMRILNQCSEWRSSKHSFWSEIKYF